MDGYSNDAERAGAGGHELKGFEFEAIETNPRLGSNFQSLSTTAQAHPPILMQRPRFCLLHITKNDIRRAPSTSLNDRKRIEPSRQNVLRPANAHGVAWQAHSVSLKVGTLRSALDQPSDGPVVHRRPTDHAIGCSERKTGP